MEMKLQELEDSLQRPPMDSGLFPRQYVHHNCKKPGFEEVYSEKVKSLVTCMAVVLQRNVLQKRLKLLKLQRWIFHPNHAMRFNVDGALMFPQTLRVLFPPMGRAWKRVFLVNSCGHLSTLMISLHYCVIELRLISFRIFSASSESITR